MEKKIKERWKELPELYKIQLWAVLFAGICGAIAYPLTTKLIYSSVETEILASRLVLSSVIGIVLSILWLSIQERLYKYFIHFTIIESLCYIFLIAYVIIFQDFNSYLIMSTIIGGTIGHIVAGAGNKLHQKITSVEQYRTDYGFFIEIVSCLGVLLGSAIAVIFNITMPIAFLLLLISLIGFEVTDIYVYLSVKKQEQK
jgi:hypothetical protein